MQMVSSAPSSAYYSDLSMTAVPTERAYEVVGLNVLSSPMPNWASSSNDIHTQQETTHLHNLNNDSSSSGNHSNTSSISSNPDNRGANSSSSNVRIYLYNANRPTRPNRLSAINESTTTIPSDYI